ncbi:MAG: methyltransferase domain-containing protein [Proteobacteria bacterium]|nr:methyltransferase domain-containing protein [Pseudomonadota bacterium]
MPEQVAARFSDAALRYEQAARIQQQAAVCFDDWLAQLPLAAPNHIVEIGCGTGLLTRLLHARYQNALLYATDLAPAMLDFCRKSLPADTHLQFSLCDGRSAQFDPTPDWIVSTMCFQWFDPLPPVLARHADQCRVLAFSILLDGSFSDWRAAHQRAGIEPGLRPLPDYDALLQACANLGGKRVHAQRLTLTDLHADGRAFARSLRAIGADWPRVGHRPTNLRPVLRQLRDGVAANYEIGMLCVEM